MARSCLGLAEERLVPFEATRHIAYADDRPGAFHDISPAGLAMYIWFRINPATYVLFRIKPCATFCQVSGYQQIVECRTRPLGFMRIRINPNRRGSECICRNSSQMKRRPCEMTPGQSGSMQIQSGIS